MLKAKFKGVGNTANLLELYIIKSVQLNADSLQTLVTLAKTHYLPSL
jgi:hypothetical protein